MKKILVLAPHMDDEMSCAGSISRFIEEGHDVYCVAFTSAGKSVPKGLPKNALARDFNKSMRLLNIKKSNIITFEYEVRTFPSVRQEILDDMISLNNKIQPDIVITTSSFDTHQDHEVIHAESVRAFRGATVLGYECPWNNLNFSTDLYIPLEERHIYKKITIVDNYISQRKRRKGGPLFFKDLASVHGAVIGVEYAECFEVIRIIIGKGFKL